MWSCYQGAAIKAWVILALPARSHGGGGGWWMVVNDDGGGGWWWMMVADDGWWCSLSLVPSRAALEQYQCIYFFCQEIY